MTNLYDKIMGRSTDPSLDAATAPGIADATIDPFAGSFLDAPTFDTMGTPTASGAPSSDNMGRIGSGVFGNKPLPLDEASGTAGRIIDAAKSYLGTPYVWGGTSQQGIDCSGLVQAAYAAAGIHLPRVSYQQAAAGQRIALKNLQPGDIVAYNNSTRNPGADHLAVYLGNGKMIEAARPGTNVHITSIYDTAQAYGVRILPTKAR